MVSSTDTINNLLMETLVRNSFTEQLQTNASKNKSSLEDILSQLSEQTSLVPSALNQNTLSDLIDGKYSISLKDYTNLSTYNTAMTRLYGNKSANPFQNILNNLLGTNDSSWKTAKSFVEQIKEKGVDSASAIKMYSAFQKYSLADNLYNLNNSSYVSAKI